MLFEGCEPRFSADLGISHVASLMCAGSPLRGTREALAHILRNPSADVALLRKRRRDVLSVRGNVKRIDSDAESDFGWLLEYDVDDDLKELLETPFFGSIATSWMNRVWLFLGANNVYGTLFSPAFSLVTPLLYLLSPIFILRFRYGIKIGVLNYARLMYQSFRLGGEMIMLASGRAVSVASMALSLMGAVFVYVQNVMNAFRHARNLYIACEKICSKVEGACRFAKQARAAMGESGWTEAEAARWVSDSGEVSGDPLLADSLAGTSFKPYDPRFGRALVCFRRADRARMRSFARQVAVFDAVRCVARSLDRTAFATFGGPGLLARGLRHPLVENCVGNDVALGFKAPGVVLTGANASGKSTLMRSVALASVMAQSVTVCFCDAIAVAPVQDVFTHMCIPDDVLDGKSRFQAEMGNVGEIISNAESGRSCILVIDELFSSTTSDQSVVCLDSVLRRLSGYPGCMFILATHHEVAYDGVRRCKMETSNSNFEHSYKMVAGVNEVFNATAGFC